MQSTIGASARARGRARFTPPHSFLFLEPPSSPSARPTNAALPLPSLTISSRCCFYSSPGCRRVASRCKSKSNRETLNTDRRAWARPVLISIPRSWRIQLRLLAAPSWDFSLLFAQLLQATSPRPDVGRHGCPKWDPAARPARLLRCHGRRATAPASPSPRLSQATLDSDRRACLELSVASACACVALRSID